MEWQCEQLENAEYCLFKRGNCSGFGNYTVGIVNREKLVRILYMLDSHGCIAPNGIYEDQLDFISAAAKKARRKCSLMHLRRAFDFGAIVLNLT